MLILVTYLIKTKKKQVNQRLEQMQNPTVCKLHIQKLSEEVKIIFVNETQPDLVSELGNAICKKFHKPVCLYKILSSGMVSLSFRSKVEIEIYQSSHVEADPCIW